MEADTQKLPFYSGRDAFEGLARDAGGFVGHFYLFIKSKIRKQNFKNRDRANAFKYLSVYVKRAA